MTIRILVVDDQEVVRDAFGALLGTQPDFTVVAAASTGIGAVELCARHHPDVVIMDVRMPGMDGIEATRRIVAQSEGDGPRILMLTTFGLDEYVYDALAAGASGFLLKDTAAERLFDAVRTVAAGEALLAPSVTRALIAEFARLRRQPRPIPQVIPQLTAREADVLRLIAEGLSNPQIAARLVVSEETVKTHISRLLNKLGLRDRTQAVIMAYESGFIVPGGARSP
jgi:DNA-binding NarL/FixJ family response regulator